MGGAAGGQMIGLIVTPIIARLYGPEAFGDFTLVQAVASVLVPIATLRLQFALLLPDSEGEVKTLLKISLSAVTVLAVFLGAGATVVARLVDTDTVLATWEGGFWAGAMIWATGLFAVLSQVALRDHNYSSVALRQVTQHGSTGVIQIGWGLAMNNTYVGLTLGRMLGLVLSCIPLLKGVRSYWAASGGSSTTLVLRRYWRYPAILMPSAVLNVLGSQLPILLVASVFSSHVAGQLGMGNRIALIPATLLGLAISQVFAAEAAATLRSGGRGILKSFVSLAGKLSLVAVLVAAGLYFLAPWAFEVFLGTDWGMAAEMTQVMSISVSLGMIASPLSTIFLVLQASKTSFGLDALRVVAILCVFSVLQRHGADPVESVMWLFTTQAFIYLMTIIAAYLVTRQHERNL